jgi:hypothetical protein
MSFSPVVCPRRSGRGSYVGRIGGRSPTTPSNFLEYFSDFGFRLSGELQDSRTFLKNRWGDCDDFAILAAQVLKAKGYTPHLIVVAMEKEVHVVCYVAETQTYLDYNHRRDNKQVLSSGALDDIATKVAASFKTNWISVSEFTWVQGKRRFLRTEFQ